MTQPLLTKQSFLIAIFTLAQALMPALVALATLYLSVLLAGDVFDPSATVIMTVLCWLVFQPTRGLRARPTPSRRLATVHVMLKWLLMLAMLLAIDRIPDDSPLQAYSTSFLLEWALATLMALVAATLALEGLRRRFLMDAFGSRSAIIAGYNNSALKLARRLRRNPGMQLEVSGFFDDRMDDRLEVESDVKILGNLGDLGAYVKTHRTDVIFVALPNREVQRVMTLMDDLRDTTASIYYVPDSLAFDRIEPRSVQIQGMPVIAIGEAPFYGFRGVGKRLTDLGLTLLALLLLSPLLLLLALTVKIAFSGPAIYKQRRYGLDGREINVYKFRTRHRFESRGENRSADEAGGRIGEFLRRSSLDGLPQLINVLQGRMSLVGPQPHAVDHSEEYRKRIKGYMVRHKVLPGITGLAQVNGSRGEIGDLKGMQARVDWDLEYLGQWSPKLDVKILLLALAHWLRRDSWNRGDLAAARDA